MKGLLIKDFKLIKGQKNFFLMIVLIGVWMIMFMEDFSFIIGYMAFIGGMFSLSTISYDEADNGNAFLFTLPVTRKGYVVEKYEFGLLTGGSFWLLATVIVLIAGITKDLMPVKDMLMTAFLILPVLFLIISVTLPFQLKFGGEKGRIAIIGAAGLLFVIGIAVVRIGEIFHVDLISAFNILPAVSMAVLIAAAIGISVIILLISLRISIAIMNRKEF